MPTATILLVDDSPELGLIARGMARRAGWSITHCLDAASAWECLRGTLPDLVLLDVNLPGERGTELCRRLRAEPRCARLPIAIFTLPSLGDDVAEGLEAGADYFVSKDLAGQPDAWQARLAEVLGHAQRITPVDPATPPRATLNAVGWREALRTCLHEHSLRSLGPSVTRVLLRRALNGTDAVQISKSDSTLGAVERAVLDLDALPLDFDPRPLVASLADQAARLLGTRGAAPFRAVLSALSISSVEMDGSA